MLHGFLVVQFTAFVKGGVPQVFNVTKQKCNWKINVRAAFWIEKTSNNAKMKHFGIGDQPELSYGPTYINTFVNIVEYFANSYQGFL